MTSDTEKLLAPQSTLKMNPAIANVLGYDLDAMTDSEKVTVVRRRIVYEELVMSKSEFDAMNKKTYSENWDDDEEFYLSELEMKDIGFPDFTNEEYIAFPGDVTSCTDDAIAFLYKNQEWIDGFGSEHVKIASR
jgi:hypothetical protein